MIYLLILLFCSDQTLAPFRSGIQPLTFPALDKMEPAVRDHIAKVQSNLVQLIDQTPEDLEKIGGDFAHLARVYHAHELYQPAEICYRNALQLLPDQFDCVYLLARLYDEKSEVDAAENWYAKAAKLRPDYSAIWINLGEIALSRHDLSTSGQLFQRALKINPNSPAGWFGLGRTALAEGKAEQAVSHFENALKLQPAADLIHYSLGMAFRKLGQRDQARTQLSRAGKIGVRATDPLLDDLQDLVKSERIHLVQGKTAFNAGHYADAEREFRLALSTNPESTGALLNLGTALALQSKTSEAIEAYTKVLERDPNHQTVLYNLGNLHTRMRKPQLAEQYLSRAVDLDPNDLQARMELGDLLRDRGAMQAAFEQYDRVAAVNPKHEDALIRRAYLLIVMEDYVRARQLLAADHERVPTMGRLAHLYARFLASCPQTELRNGELALQLASRVANARPSAQYLETLAMAYAQTGRCDDAATVQQRAIEAARAAQRPDLAAQLATDLARYQRAPPCLP